LDGVKAGSVTAGGVQRWRNPRKSRVTGRRRFQGVAAAGASVMN
jgi:hypothetical protein